MIKERSKAHYHESFLINHRSPYGNFFLKIGLGIAKDMSKMDPPENYADTPLPRLQGWELGEGYFYIGCSSAKFLFLDPLNWGVIMGEEWGKLVEIMSQR